MKEKFISICLFLTLGLFLINQSIAQRIEQSINSGWIFKSEGDPLGQKISVSLPHTWNNKDANDEVPGYYRGLGFYEKSLIIPESQRNKTVVLYFKGANQITELFVNNKYVGKHIGGYTQFSFDITHFVLFSEQNLIQLKVDNRHNRDIPPLSADFTFFGGVYRDVIIKYINKLHITPFHYATTGVYVETPVVDSNNAFIQIKSHINNKQSRSASFRIEHTIFDPNQKQVLVLPITQILKPNESKTYNTDKIQISNPKLWSTDKPHLYTLSTKIIDVQSNQVIDEVVNSFGLRWFSFSPTEGFFLNGKYLKLIGTNRHQDFKGLGNALPDDMHIRDVLLLKNMGGNFLRISHYPQDPLVMDMCDKLGIITSVEIPIVDAITESEDFANNSISMLKEMVYQDFNRPSVMIWCYMNEVLLRLPVSKDVPAYKDYLRSVEKLARRLEDTLKFIDSARATMIPFHGAWKEYEEAGLHKIPDILGGNIYRGWYNGKFEDFGTFVDDMHKRHPEKVIMVSEYGADADPRLHSMEPERFDYTAEYAMQYHYAYRRVIESRKFIAGATIWNLNDFHSEIREFAVPTINNKGITGVDREIKDGYLYYSAFLKREPYLAIGMHNWKYRGGYADSLGFTYQNVTIYSNQSKVELMLNGKSLGVKNINEYIAVFDVPFTNGEQKLEAFAIDEQDKRVNSLTDLVLIQFKQIPYKLTAENFPSSGIHIMLGSKRFFEDRDAQIVWLPEQAYRQGNIGYIGGSMRRQSTRHGSTPASDSDIKGTQTDGIFQTQRIGIQSFKADVPDGIYSVELYFAELEIAQKKEALAYNLGNTSTDIKDITRVFGIAINDQPFIDQINIAKEFGPTTLASVKTKFYVKNGQGMLIRFLPKDGEPILNAIRILRHN